MTFRIFFYWKMGGGNPPYPPPLYPPLIRKKKVSYLALINRAGDLYGRILTEVASTERTQRGLYTRPRSRFSHTDRLSSVNKMFFIWQRQEQFNSFNVTGLYWLTFCLRTAGDEPNLILPKFTLPLYFFSHQLFGTYRNKYFKLKTVNDFAF